MLTLSKAILITILTGLSIMTGCAQLPAPTDKTASLGGGTSGESTATECNTAHIPGAYSCAMQAHLAKMRAERKAWKKNRPTNWTTELTDFFKLQLQNEDGYIDPQGLIKANRQREEMFATKNEIRRKNPQASFADAGIKSKADWQFIGPKNIGGRTRSLLFVKQKDGSTALYAGTATGGIWKSTDYGKNWNPPPEKMLLSGLPISTLAADPVPDPNTGYIPLYAGTGEQMNHSTVDTSTLFQGSGILRSNDEGVTWEKIPATDPKGVSNSEWYYVNKIAISTNTPINGQAIRIATTGKGLRKQSLGKATEEWLSVSYGNSCNSYYLGEAVGDVKINPGDSNFIVAGGLKTNVIYYSSDGGNNWNCTSLSNNGIKENDGRIELAFAKTITRPDASIPGNANSVLYAAIDSHNGTIYRSLDNGKTWQYRSNPQHFYSAYGGTSQGNYDNAIWVDPNDHNHIVIGGIFVQQSTDGGESFIQVPTYDTYFSSNSNSIHSDIHAIVESPLYGFQNNSVIFFATDGGVYVVFDISKVNKEYSFEVNISQMESRNNGLSVTQFYSGVGRTYPDGSIRIAGGTQDNYSLVYSENPVHDWTPFLNGDGAFSAIQRSADGYVFASQFKANNFMKTAVHPDGTFASTDISSYSTSGSSIVYLHPFVLDPNNDNRMYLGRNNLFVSNDVNNQKSVLGKDDPWQPSGTLHLVVGAISAIAVAKGNPHLLWISQQPTLTDRKIYPEGESANFLLKKIENQFTPPLSVTKRYSFPTYSNRFIHRILIDENDHNRLLAGLGSYSPDNLLRSTDDGNTFQSISGIVPGKKLPDAPVRTIARHPNNPNWLYVGTGVGVYTTENAYATQTKNTQECISLPADIETKDPQLEGCGVIWAINDGPANVDVHELFWLEDGRLGAATHGRGMWLAKLNAFTAPSTVTVTDDGNTTLSASFTVDDAYHRTPSKNEIKLFVAALVGGELYFKSKVNGTDLWDRYDGRFIPYYETRQIKAGDKHLFHIVPIVENIDVSGLKGTEVYVGYASCKNESLRKTITDVHGKSLEIAGVALDGECWKDMLKDGSYDKRQFGLVYTVQ